MKWLSIVIFLIPIPSFAMSVTVKAGEHGEFTRLVIYSQGKQEIDISKLSNELRIEYQQPIQRLITADVFSRLNQGRIKAIRKSGTWLIIELNCQCEAAEMRTQFGQLYFDIRESNLAIQAAPLVLPPFEFVHLPKKVKPKTEPNFVLEQHLLEQALFSAAKQKLLLKATEPDLISDQRGIASEKLTINTDPEAVSLGAKLKRIENANGTTCIENERLSVNNWLDDRPFARQLSEAIAPLSAEFDRINDAAVEQLIKVYLAFGFGAEARNVSTTTGGHVDPLLEALATIIHNPSVPNRFFENQESCNGPAALWAVISANKPFYAIDENEIYLAYSALPKHLKTVLTEPLVSSLSENGFAELSHRILALSQTTAKTIENRADLVAVNGDASSETDLNNIEREIETASVVSPKVAITYVKLKAQRQEAISPKIVSILEGVLWDHRKGEVGATLENAIGVTYLLAAQYEAFLNNMYQIEWEKPFSNYVVELIAAHAPDDVLLRTSVSKIFGASNEFEARFAALGLHDNVRKANSNIQSEGMYQANSFEETSPISSSETLIKASENFRNALVQNLAEIALRF